MSWEPDYCTADELFHYARQTDADLQSADEVEAAVAITGASRAIDVHTNRQFGVDSAPTTRYYRSKLCTPTMRVVKIDDLMTTAGLTVTKADGGAEIEYALTPVNNLVKNKPYTGLRLFSYVPTALSNAPEDVAVTGTFGWTSVPAPVKQACLLQASRFLARREAPFGIAGSPDQGSEMRLLARVDPDVGVSLMKYVRWWG